MQAKTIEEQVAGRCEHFTGLMDKKCKAGVEYDSFGRVKLGVIPCLKGGTKTCDKVKFPTPEEVKKQVEEMANFSEKAIKLLFAAKDHFEKTKQDPGKFPCPFGDDHKEAPNHLAWYQIAGPRRHFWVRCSTCNIALNE